MCVESRYYNRNGWDVNAVDNVEMEEKGFERVLIRRERDVQRANGGK